MMLPLINLTWKLMLFVKRLSDGNNKRIIAGFVVFIDIYIINFDNAK